MTIALSSVILKSEILLTDAVINSPTPAFFEFSSVKSTAFFAISVPIALNAIVRLLYPAPLPGHLQKHFYTVLQNARLKNFV